MKLQQEMYSELEKWKSSGQSRADFVKVKTYTLAKFDYWIRRYKKEKIKPTKSSFKEIPITKPIATPAVKVEKLVELDLPSGIKITVYK